MIYIANSSQQRIGGGWSFIDNLKKGMQTTDDYNQAEIFFIASPSMVQREEVQKAMADGKKIVLRVDNAVRNSRNRNTGMTRMFDFAQWADLVIYQSEWSRDYLKPFLKKDGPVILNGVDLDRFHPGYQKEQTVLYSRFNRDETKNYEAARYWYSRYQYEHPEAKLYIVGQFSDELRQGNFDFYNDENFEYLGVLNEIAMGKIYRLCSKFLYTYYNDCCSNSLIEALASGCEIVGDEYYRSTGGAPEIIDSFRKLGRDYFSIERMANDYKEAIDGIMV